MLLTFLSMLILGIGYYFKPFHFSTEKLQERGGDSLWFQVRTASVPGNYAPKHVLAIWIKDSMGNFIKTCKVRASTRVNYLTKWVANSSKNTTDAITGSTLNSHTTHTVSWDCTDKNGQVVPDGKYEIWVEVTSNNSTGPYTVFTFEKGRNPVTLQPADQTYFKNVKIVYTPGIVAVNQNKKNDFELDQNSPNPFSQKTLIRYTVPETQQVQLNIFDSRGNLVRTLVNEMQQPGEYYCEWTGDDEHGHFLPSGTYYYLLQVANQSKVKRAILFRGMPE